MKFIVGVASVLLAGGVTIAAAQGPAGPGGGEPKDPAKDAIPERVAPGPEKRPAPGGAAEAPGGKERGKVAKDKDGDDRKAAAPDSDKKGDDRKSTKTGKADRDEAPAPRKDRADVKDSDKKPGPTAEDAGRKGDKSAPKSGAAASDKAEPKTGSKAPDKSDPKTGSTASDKSSPKSGDDTTAAAAKKPDDARRDAQITEKQRTSVREKLKRERSSHVAKVRFNVTIGARVPRDVVVYPIPADVITIVPEYRSYRYVWLDDEIVIIDPATYIVIATVDDRPTHAGRGGPRLSLSDAERTVVVRHVAARRDSARLGGLTLGVGDRVKDSVRLLDFPDTVIAEIPRLRDYKYVLVGDEVVVIEPRQSVVVLTIEQ